MFPSNDNSLAQQPSDAGAFGVTQRLQVFKQGRAQTFNIASVIDILANAFVASTKLFVGPPPPSLGRVPLHATRDPASPSLNPLGWEPRLEALVETQDLAENAQSINVF